MLTWAKSPAAQSDHECALSPNLAEKDTHNLQESFECAVHGEDKDNREDHPCGNRNDNSNEDEACAGEGEVSSAKAWVSVVRLGKSTKMTSIPLTN